MAAPTGDKIRVREEIWNEAGSEQAKFQSMAAAATIARRTEKMAALSMSVEEESLEENYLASIDEERLLNEFINNDPQRRPTDCGSMHQTTDGRWIDLAKLYAPLSPRKF
jgi:hypothetical protein